MKDYVSDRKRLNWRKSHSREADIVPGTLSPSWDGELSYEKTNQHLNEFIYQLKRKDCK